VLPALVHEALVANHDLQAAAARLEQAQEVARIAVADLQPQVGAGLSAARQRQVFVGFPIPGSAGNVLSTQSTRYGVSLDATWEVDLWGRLRAGARAAVADAQAVAADVRGARLSLASQTARAWFAAVEAAEQRRLARATASSRQESAAAVRVRYEQGLRPALDLRLALSQQAEAAAAVQQRQAQLDLVVRQLEALLGRYPGGALEGRLEAASLPALPPPVPAGLPAEVFGRRPDLVAAERRLAAAAQRRQAARRALYPRLTLTAAGGTASDQLGDLLDGDFRVWSLVAGLTQPLFQGGRLRAGVRRAQAAEEEALASWAGAALRAFAEVESALAVAGALAAREQLLAASAQQLGAARQLAGERYRSGVGDYLTLLESESREHAARSALLSVRRQRLDNRIDLHLALGGGFHDPGPATLAEAQR
jgi:NodT family efflux transporter outer membrane factor (OMF) lipoprotein